MYQDELLGNVKVIGTCSICGGQVVIPLYIHKVGPITPYCIKCHATPKKPVIPMEPAKPSKTEDFDWETTYQKYEKRYEREEDYDKRPRWTKSNRSTSLGRRVA